MCLDVQYVPQIKISDAGNTTVMQCSQLPNSNDQCSIVYGGKVNNVPNPTGSAPDAIPGLLACSCRMDKRLRRKHELILNHTSR